MDPQRLEGLIDRFLAAWNAQDVERVAACYTDDVRYLDPNTQGYVEGGEALRRYLRKLFAGWQMTWARREVFEIAGEEGVAFLWHATFRRVGETRTVEADGMDLAVLRGDRLCRNEVYFDRTALLPPGR